MGHGGKRPGTGRKKGSGKYGEPTTAIRIPVSMLEAVTAMLIQFPKRLKPEPGRTRVSEVHAASVQTQQPLTLYATRVAAGSPSPTEDYTEGKLDLNTYLLRNPGATFFVRVSGDSMIEAGIHPGDLLIVDRSLPPAVGKVVIAVINGELTVKRLFRERGKLFLMPENPAYPSLEITEEMDFMIWGVVTSVIHPL